VGVEVLTTTGDGVEGEGVELGVVSSEIVVLAVTIVSVLFLEDSENWMVIDVLGA